MWSASLLHCSSWFICTNVEPQGANHRSACPVLCHSESSPLGLSVCECRATGSASGQTASPCSSHSPTVSVPPQQHESSPPWLPSSVPPTGLDECLFFISLVSDFLAIRFSVSSGCARRRSVSTYAAILVLPLLKGILKVVFRQKESSLIGMIQRQQRNSE